MSGKHFFVSNADVGAVCDTLSADTVLPNNILNSTYTFMNFYHQNLCGVSNKIHELELYLESLDIQHDFICITEHFLNKVTAPLFHLHGHKLVSYNVRPNKRRGGSLIIGQSDKVVEDLQVCKKLYKCECFEICGIRDVSTNIYVCCCYRNPVDKNFDMFIDQLEKFLEHFLIRSVAYLVTLTSIFSMIRNRLVIFSRSFSAITLGILLT